MDGACKYKANLPLACSIHLGEKMIAGEIDYRYNIFSLKTK